MKDSKGNHAEKRMFYAVQDLTQIAGISRSLAYSIVQREDFPKIRVGKRILIPVDAFDRWIAEQMEH